MANIISSPPPGIQITDGNMNVSVEVDVNGRLKTYPEDVEWDRLLNDTEFDSAMDAFNSISVKVAHKHGYRINTINKNGKKMYVVELNTIKQIKNIMEEK